ncbi:MAG: NAD-dependent epimerase/dehydratase family protein, partial [Gammaproteobacteria bacterium]|nr:NAD-dependent epimerase/dehydratase family protein [Gammaproteobacteria bacterium]
LQNKPLTMYGDGEQTRSFCFIRDQVRGLIKLMNKNHYHLPVNIGNPNEFTINELAEIVLEVTGSSSVIEHRPLPTDDPTQRQPDITRARDRGTRFYADYDAVSAGHAAHQWIKTRQRVATSNGPRS